MENNNLFANEIQLADDECCIIFDLACFFPYSNYNILAFNFSYGTEKNADYKINHRYPNKGFQTISRKYGRKVSKIGYPFILKLNEQKLDYINISVGIKEKSIMFSVPIVTKMTKEKPICNLSLKYFFDECKFIFSTYGKSIDDDGWNVFRWSNKDNKKMVVFY